MNVAGRKGDLRRNEDYRLQAGFEHFWPTLYQKMRE